MKSSLYLFLWITIVFSNNGSCQETQYFPLETGYSWTFDYNLNSAIFIDSIIGVENINDIDYYKFSRLWLEPEKLIRVDENNQLLEREGDAELLKFKFNADVGNSWDYPGGQIVLESRSDTVTVPAGTFTECLRFHYYFNGSDNDWDEWFAPDIGPVKRIHYTIFLSEYRLIDFNFNPQTNVSHPDQNSKGFALLQNTPNPLNLQQGNSSSTTIKYQIPAGVGSIEVNLSLYDSTGKKVVTLVDGSKGPGLYEVEWSGKNGNGALVSGGVYFISLTAEGEVLVKKVLVIR